MKTLTNIRTVDVVDQPGRMPYKRTASGHYAKDTLITTPTQAELEAYQRNMQKVDLGQTWDGTPESLDSMEPDVRGRLFEQVDNYRSKDRRKTGDAADSFLGRTPAAARQGIQSINDANRNFWNRKV